MHTCVHAYMHTYIHTYIHAYIHIHTCIHHLHMHVCLYARSCYIHTCIHTSYIYLQCVSDMFIHAQKRIHAYIGAMCMYLYVNTYKPCQDETQKKKAAGQFNRWRCKAGLGWIDYLHDVASFSPGTVQLVFCVLRSLRSPRMRPPSFVSARRTAS